MEFKDACFFCVDCIDFVSPGIRHSETACLYDIENGVSKNQRERRSCHWNVPVHRIELSGAAVYRVRQENVITVSHKFVEKKGVLTKNID